MLDFHPRVSLVASSSIDKVDSMNVRSQHVSFTFWNLYGTET